MSILDTASGGYQVAMENRKLSTQHLLHQIRLEYQKDGSGRLGQLSRLMDEALCAGDPLPEEWLPGKPSRRSEITVRIQDNYL